MYVILFDNVDKIQLQTLQWQCLNICRSSSEILPHTGSS
jgi:hypothetical protein